MKVYEIKADKLKLAYPRLEENTAFYLHFFKIDIHGQAVRL